MTTENDLFIQLRQANARIESGVARLEAANVAQGFPADSIVIRGEDALAAANDIQAANRRQSEIIEQLLKE